MKAPMRFSLLMAVVVLTVPLGAMAQSFSTAPGGSIGLFPDHIWAPSGGAFPPGLHINGAGAGYNVDALSLGYASADWFFVQGFFFSVDYASAGLPATAVATEAAVPLDQGADAFFVNPIAAPGINLQMNDGDGVGSVGPGLSLGVVEGGTDRVDAWDNRNVVAGPALPVYFSFDVITAPFVGGRAADVYVGPAISGSYDALGTYGTYATAAALGLDASTTNTDEIDALVVFDDGAAGFGGGPGTDYVMFSLAPGSAAFTNFSAYHGFTAGDVLYADSTGTKGRLYTAAQMGLAPGDNLDALDVEVIPEPGTVALIGIGLAIIGIAKRRTRSA